MALDGTPDELTPRRRRAVVALLGGGGVDVAAAEAGVARRTIFRWQRSPAFQAAIAEGARLMFTASLNVLRASAPAAAATLMHLRDSATDSVRLRASRAVFDVLRRGDLDDLLARVEALERAARSDETAAPATA